MIGRLFFYFYLFPFFVITQIAVAMHSVESLKALSIKTLSAQIALTARNQQPIDDIDAAIFQRLSTTLVSAVKYDFASSYGLISRPSLSTVLMEHTDSISCLAKSNCSDIIYSGSDDNNIKIWHAASGTCLNTLKDHNSYVFCLLESKNGRRLLFRLNG